MSVTEDITAEIVALMHAMMRNDLGSALTHQKIALQHTRLAIQLINLEIATCELHQRPIGPLASMKLMYGDVEKCLREQRDAIEHIAVAFASIQALRSGVVGET